MKRKSTTNNLDNIIQSNKYGSPPLKIRAVQNKPENQETNVQNKRENVNIVKTKSFEDQEDTIMAEDSLPAQKSQRHENVVHSSKTVNPTVKEDDLTNRIKSIEEILQQMIEQKKEDDKIKQILQEDLIRANEYITRTLEAKENNPASLTSDVPETDNEEFLTDSEEEKVNRNTQNGRGFLKAKRTKKKVAIHTFDCTQCRHQSHTEHERENHMGTHKTEEELLYQGKEQGYRRTDPANVAQATKVSKKNRHTVSHLLSAM